MLAVKPIWVPNHGLSLRALSGQQCGWYGLQLNASLRTQSIAQ